MKEARHKRKYIAGVHLYKVQRQTKIICNVGNKDSITFETEGGAND